MKWMAGAGRGRKGEPLSVSAQHRPTTHMKVCDFVLGGCVLDPRGQGI